MLQVDIEKKLWSSTGEMQLKVAFEVKNNQRLAIYGPSGAGKTSLLRILAGLMKPDVGLITFEDKTWVNTHTNIHSKPQVRHIGYLFQSYALFPNMSVLDNIKYAQNHNQDSIVEELISIMELGALVRLRPQQLSGGQQQRVALARAIVRKPSLLLLDEPLSALDYETKIRLKSYIQSLQARFPCTLIMVSHNPSDIMALAENVICLDAGVITDIGDPATIFKQKYGDNLSVF